MKEEEQRGLQMRLALTVHLVFMFKLIFSLICNYRVWLLKNLFMIWATVYSSGLATSLVRDF